MLSEKNFPKKIENSNDDERGIPMKINYNKHPLFLQGSGHLIEEINRTV
jgi:hypothetical protein